LPFIRHARDKRGYDTTFVMHAYRAGTGNARTRILYVFRSPPNLKVGRRVLDPEVVEALEHTHPDLTFDWPVLMREPAPPRVDPRERWQRPGRSGGSGGQRSEPPSRPAPEPTPPPVIEDHSLLGRTLGAREAGRLRAKYQELLQRVARRARTPEDRDRLTERAHRLNPEEWLDETTIRGQAPAAETEWGAIAAELPSRRRGRRGGRFRGDQPPATTPPATGGAGDRSGIITGEGESDEESLDAFDAGSMGQDAGHVTAGDGRGFGADATASADHPADAPDPGTGADAPGADGPGVPRRDGDHHD
jgi:hypothetical protein